ncbi:MAG: DUF4433 domain-containing protein [Deltaproteobacteria bacterium]|nr:DUF4433 domain-containing protein [Deltaproteobacteria bacterium]
MSNGTTMIYHITHKDNLEGIIARGGLVAQSEMAKDPISYCNIAHITIQDRRAYTPVPCGPGGNLHDYVPFYFAPRSPMLYAIHRGNVENCTAGQTDIIYLVSSAESVAASGLEFTFTDGHGIMTLSDFYDDFEDLDAIDWDVMKAKYWRDTDDDPDRKRRRQAEFLVYKEFPWDMVEMIAVMNSDIKINVGGILSNAPQKPPIHVKPEWYY